MLQNDSVKEFISAKISSCFTKFHVTITGGSEQKNYFGSVYKVTIDGIKNGQNVTEYFFVKTHSDSKERNERLNIEDKFRREALVYDVIREYELLQLKISAKDRLCFPMCVYADEKWLLLEDLSKIGFKEHDEKSNLDLEHILIMMKDIAKFHALSFALKQSKPRLFEHFKSKLEKPNIANKQRRAFITEKVWQWTVDALEDQDIKNRLIKLKADIFKEYDDFNEANYIVINHGDFNLRNVLFHYNDMNQPNQMMMIDFQLSYTTSPVADVLFAIFSSTSSDLRRNYYKQLQDAYYENFQRFIALLQCDADLCYPRKTYEEDFFKYFPRECMTILVILRLMCIAFKDESKPVGNPGNSQAKAATILEYNSDEAEEAFKIKINEVINDFALCGYI